MGVCTLHLERLCLGNRQKVRSVFSFWLLKLNYSMGKLFNSGTDPVLTNISNNRLVQLLTAQRIGIGLNNMLVLKIRLH